MNPHSRNASTKNRIKFANALYRCVHLFRRATPKKGVPVRNGETDSGGTSVAVGKVSQVGRKHIAYHNCTSLLHSPCQSKLGQATRCLQENPAQNPAPSAESRTVPCKIEAWRQVKFMVSTPVRGHARVDILGVGVGGGWGLGGLGGDRVGWGGGMLTFIATATT